MQNNPFRSRFSEVSNSKSKRRAKIVFVFGNPDVPSDSLPLKMLPRLKRHFPEIEFKTVDPNEEWDVPERLIAIDAVKGIDRVTVFGGLQSFSRSPRVTMHDFDALANLRLLEKLGKLKKIKIIGVPRGISEEGAASAVSELLSSI